MNGTQNSFFCFEQKKLFQWLVTDKHVKRFYSVRAEEMMSPSAGWNDLEWRSYLQLLYVYVWRCVCVWRTRLGQIAKKFSSINATRYSTLHHTATHCKPLKQTANSVYLRQWIHVAHTKHVCVCVWERERKKENERDREKQRELPSPSPSEKKLSDSVISFSKRPTLGSLTNLHERLHHFFQETHSCRHLYSSFQPLL